MPLTSFLAALGSHCRAYARKQRIQSVSSTGSLFDASPAAVHVTRHYRATCTVYHHYRSSAIVTPLRPRSNGMFYNGSRMGCADHGNCLVRRDRCYSSGKTEVSPDPLPDLKGFPETQVDLMASSLGMVEEPIAETLEKDISGDIMDAEEVTPPRWRIGKSRVVRKAQRPSQPGLIVDAIHGPARQLYARPPPGKGDFSYVSPRRIGLGGSTRDSRRVQLSKDSTGHQAVALEERPLSIYTILERYIHAATLSPWGESTFQFTTQELRLLESNGYSMDNVKSWASGLVYHSSPTAAQKFLSGDSMPPLFVVLIFLRRKSLKRSALGIVMRHVHRRLQSEHIPWTGLKILVTRLLRHARIVWPESIPWIASVFTTEAAKIRNEAMDKKGGLSAGMLSDFTHFCNAFMVLLSLSAKSQPVLSSLHQQNAQFQVLRFMANCSPALIVTKPGFRATTRTQLAHVKTGQEREWAMLKGISWPPWMQERTAMDEGKGYEFGASRASRIMHRMYEAGYKAYKWEMLAEMYAGWDTDLSPTIQTRTLLPSMRTSQRNQRYLDRLLWAGRVQTTRTRREAWACFLAFEASKIPPGEEVYLAMFEKLHYPDTHEPHSRSDVESNNGENANKVLPGDRKEVLPEPASPMDLIYIAEPVPSYEQLYHRMRQKGVRPTGRLLAFLIDTCPGFDLTLDILKSAKGNIGSGVQRLLDASQIDESMMQALPDYLLTAFIRLLCRFGRFGDTPSVKPITVHRNEHEYKFSVDRHYLLEYAYALLLQVRPRHPPAWTAYMGKLLFGRWESTRDRGSKALAQYEIICHLVEKMQEKDIDLDEEHLRLLCIALRSAAQTAYRGHLSPEDARHIVTGGPRQIRTLFHTLVSADVAANPRDNTETSNPIPPHIPSPAVLHAYVRALGTLGDYEGLYSFVTWATSNEQEVTVRAKAQHGGPRALRRTLIAIRAALEGVLEHGPAPEELKELVRCQVEDVEDWGGWPTNEEVELYIEGKSR